MIIPPRIGRSGSIGIVAPGSPVRKDVLSKGVEYIKNRGYNVIHGAYVFEDSGYLAGNDTERCTDIQDMLRDPHISMIMCARGGYGSGRLLDKIDFSLFRNNPKILVGHSDATVLQWAVFRKTGIVTFSGPMTAPDFGGATVNSDAEQHFWKLVTGDETALDLSGHSKGDLIELYPGKARGTILCGCLSVIVGLLGTDYCPGFDNVILVLEDIGEEPYRIDRMITTLKLHGIFEKISGLVLGQFVNCTGSDENSGKISVENIVSPVVREYRIPSVMNLSYGHIPEKITIPVGAEGVLDTSSGIFRIPGKVVQ
ncbi:LD-carboxypeptidase [candidate division KSB1 bacterium]